MSVSRAYEPILARRIILFLGVLLILLSAFGVGAGWPADLFKVGVAISFAAFFA